MTPRRSGDLLTSPDARLAGFGIELARTMGSPALATELASLADDPRPDVRLGSLATRAAAGDEDARRRLADEVRRAATDPDAAVRLLAAQAIGELDAADRAAAATLLADADERVRIAAFDAVAAGDVVRAGAGARRARGRA